MALSLLIVDDHEEFRSLAACLLSAEGFRIAGDACDGASALEAVAALRPDVVLLDVQMPGIDGFEVARRLSATSDAPCVVLTSTREASDYGSQVATCGAYGFLAKHELSGAALEALVRGR